MLVTLCLLIPLPLRLILLFDLLSILFELNVSLNGLKKTKEKFKLKIQFMSFEIKEINFAFTLDKLVELCV